MILTFIMNLLIRKNLVVALLLLTLVIRPTQANPLAIAIPSAAVATYTALTAITVGSVYVFATVAHPTIPGITWSNFQSLVPTASQISDLTKTLEANIALKVALNQLRTSYNNVVAGIELAAEESDVVDQTSVLAFYNQIQQTCAAFPGQIDCSALASSFDGLLGASELVLWDYADAISPSNTESGLVPVTTASELTNSFAIEGTTSDCNSGEFFNAYNNKYDLSRDSVSNIHASMNGSGGTVSEFITMLKKGGGWGCHAIGKRRTTVTGKGEDKVTTHAFNLRFVPLEYYKYVNTGVPQDNRVKRYLMCMGWRLEKGLNDTTCTEKMKYDACERATNISRFCAKEARLR
jgi:hypothetical protein